MRSTRFVTLGLCGGLLLLLLAACGGGGSNPSSTPVDSGSPAVSETPGPPAEALLVIADPASTKAVLSQALGQPAVKKYFLTSRSEDPASFEGLAFSDQTIWGTVPTAPFAQADAFNAAYEGAYGHPASDVFGTAAAYDSVYVVALAAVAANSAERAAIRDAIPFVANTPGEITTYGEEAFATAAGVLTGGENVNYIGASGQVDLDANGEIAKTSVQTWRVINGTIARIETRDIDLVAEAGAALPEGSPPVPGATPEDSLSIGIIVPDDDNGTALSDAAQLAIDEINAAGGVWGGDVVFHIQTIGSADQASHAANLLITDAGVHAIIGPTAADSVEEVLTPAAEADVALLSLSTDPALTAVEDAKNVLFRMVASDALQMPVLANLFLEGYATPTPTEGILPGEGPLPGSVCVLYQAGDAFEQMAATYATAMEHKNATIRASVSFDPANANYESLLKDCIGS